jgi:hypothetical protein
VRAVFAWRHDVSIDAYDVLVGVHQLGETYPGLNSVPDKLRDEMRIDAASPRTRGFASAPDQHARMIGTEARVLIGLNRRGGVTLHLPIEATGHVELTWNDDVTIAQDVAGKATLELVAPTTIRGVNTLAITAPPGTLVSSVVLIATP